ncbi:unnamed protein product [Ranitomeya imitator]|uniref:Chromo domain-containing protein n=1 Tax=Ranitomeya imitator TaxID=111125 RepID=A0ABN9KW65_9NEOB|nr:unnamed protein product [Ranitomeya imitator]
MIRGRTLFLVDWKGFGPEERSWEPRENIQAPRILAKFLSSPKRREECKDRGRCGTWGKGGYKTLLGQVFYAKCSSTVALCYHHIEEAPEFSVQAKRSSDGSLENIHVKFDSIEIEVSAIGINVNSEL